MLDAVAVGGSVAPLGGAGWNAWPLIGIAVGLWIGRRIAGAPWRAPLLVAGLGAGLIFPIAVGAWGVLPSLALALAGGWLVRIARSMRPPPHTRSV
jgi:hypothetical protein